MDGKNAGFGASKYLLSKTMGKKISMNIEHSLTVLPSD
jgi:hypothetical protein